MMWVLMLHDILELDAVCIEGFGFWQGLFKSRSRPFILRKFEHVENIRFVYLGLLIQHLLSHFE